MAAAARHGATPDHLIEELLSGDGVANLQAS